MIRDHLGSILAVSEVNAAKTAASITQTFRYDPFGQQFALQANNFSAFTGYMRQGFTGHEMLNGLNIIHMNGRIYDPTIGRFLQADPHIQAPSNSQSYNRYSYVLNNPLSYTDPSGYFSLGKIGRFIEKAARPFKNVIRQTFEFLGPVGSQLAILAVCGPNPVCHGVLSYDNARAHGATKSGALRAGVTAAIMTEAFTQIGGHYKQTFGVSSFTQATATQQAQWAFTHAMAGGVGSVLQGGKFGHGFVSAGVTKYAGNFIQIQFSGDGLGDIIGGTLASAVVGGTVSKISGGKFANGARTAAYQYLYNARGGKSLLESIKEVFKRAPNYSRKYQTAEGVMAGQANAKSIVDYETTTDSEKKLVLTVAGVISGPISAPASIGFGLGAAYYGYQDTSNMNEFIGFYTDSTIYTIGQLMPGLSHIMNGTGAYSLIYQAGDGANYSQQACFSPYKCG
ncbi:RHS repeat-associated core domain-containing protein [Pseudoalteromonas sp. MMG012]|nr:RHS repeat-associated core domain-containing protein [Pseudoalteromonas sp. MMG012]